MNTSSELFAKDNFFGKGQFQKLKNSGFKSQLAKPNYKYSNIVVMLGTATITCSVTSNIVVTVTNTLTNTNTATGTTTQTCSSTSVLGTTTITLLNQTCTVTVTNSITQTTSPTATATSTASSTFTCTITTPNAPSNLTAAPELQTKMNLVWKDNASDETGFNIYRSLDNVSFEKVGSVNANVVNFQDVGLMANTEYYYYVASIIGVGPPQPSNITNATTFPLKIPTDFTAAGKNISQIELKWTQNIEAIKYEAWISETGGNDYVLAAEIDSILSVFPLPKLKHGTIYFLKMRTKYSTGFSGFTPVVNAATKTLVLNASSNSINKIDLNWNSDSPDDLGFKILFSEDANGPFVAFPNATAAHASTFTHTNLAENKTYYYQIYPDFGNDTIKLSNTSSVKTLEFKAPTITQAKGMTSKSIEVKWTPTIDAEYYKVYRKSSQSAQYVELIQLYGTTNLIDKNLDICGKYFYLVSAHNKNLIQYSNEFIGTTVVAEPINFIAKGDANLASEVLLTWANGCSTNNTSGVDYYVLERSLDGYSYVFAAKLSNTTTQYKDGQIQNSKSYFYRLKAVGSESSSGYVYATTRPAPLTPTNVSAKGIRSSQIEVFWTDNSSDETYFIVEIANDNLFTQTNKIKVETNKQSTIVDNLLPSRVYYFRVSAFREFDNLKSTYSNSANAKTCPATANNLVGVAKSASEINLSWVDNAPDEDATDVEISLDGTTFAKYGEVLSNTTAFTVTGLNASNTYWFRVFTKNSDGCRSDQSNIVQIITLPAAPSGLKGKATSLTAINLEWTDNSKLEIGFVLYQAKSNDAEFVKVLDLGPNVVSTTIKNLTAGSNYKFKIATVSSEGQSAFSNILEITSQAITANEENDFGHSIVLFPNPAKNTLSFISNGSISGKFKTSIKSITGKSLIEKNFQSFHNETEYNLNIEQLPEGIYLFEIRNDKGYLVKKFLKK